MKINQKKMKIRIKNKKKLSPLLVILTEGCVELAYAATLSNSHSLFVSLTSPLILGQDHLNKIPF